MPELLHEVLRSSEQRSCYQREPRTSGDDVPLPSRLTTEGAVREPVVEYIRRVA